MCPGKGDERVGPEVQGTVPRKLIRSFVLAQQHLLSETERKQLVGEAAPGERRRIQAKNVTRKPCSVKFAQTEKANEAPGCREAPATLGK